MQVMPSRPTAGVMVTLDLTKPDPSPRRLIGGTGGCPVKEAGIGPSARCDGCDGRPARGQRRIRPRTPICEDGGPATHVFSMISGYAREIRVAGGQTVGLRLIGPGELIGVDGIWTGRYGCTVEALTAATVCVIDTRSVSSHLDDDAEKRTAIERFLAAQVDQLREIVMRRQAMTAEERVLSLLREVLGAQSPNTWMRLPFSRCELAEHLGLAEGTVSRMIQRLARKGLIEVDGRMFRMS